MTDPTQSIVPAIELKQPKGRVDNCPHQFQVPRWAYKVATGQRLVVSTVRKVIKKLWASHESIGGVDQPEEL